MDTLIVYKMFADIAESGNGSGHEIIGKGYTR